ncbi:hypothetical protein [Streptomyces sp. ODS28]|uniref:hypothetical protein n=1 Tax=Streptomyces sp. ODS28 TaxID=3136688 RepID=UPI0031E95083
MKSLLGFVSFVLIAQGAGALVHHFVGWFSLWTLVHRVGFLSGYEVYAGIVLLVLGVAVGAASDKVEDG